MHNSAQQHTSEPDLMFCEACEPVLLLFTQISTCTKFLPVLQYYFVSSTLFVYIKEHLEQDQS